MFTNPGEFFNQILFNSFYKDGNTIFKSFVLWFGEFLVSSFVKKSVDHKEGNTCSEVPLINSVESSFVSFNCFCEESRDKNLDIFWKFQLTDYFFHHAFVVFKTAKHWWSIEKNDKGVTLQRSTEKNDVRDVYGREKRNGIIKLGNCTREIGNIKGINRNLLASS